jgi:hypothetical protein
VRLTSTINANPTRVILWQKISPIESKMSLNEITTTNTSAAACVTYKDVEPNKGVRRVRKNQNPISALRHPKESLAAIASTTAKAIKDGTAFTKATFRLRANKFHPISRPVATPARIKAGNLTGTVPLAVTTIGFKKDPKNANSAEKANHTATDEPAAYRCML